MADNSKRERLIIANKDLIDSVETIKTVLRVRPTYSDLQNFAQTQFPVAAIVGRLPVPEPKDDTRTGTHEQFIMELKVDAFIYLQVNDDADTEISDFADDLWEVLLSADQKRGMKECFFTEVTLHEKIHVYRPFAAFQVTITHKYITDTGGI